MSILTPEGDRPKATLDMLSGSQGLAIGTADTRVVGGNMYSTTYTYTNNVHAAPLQQGCPAPEKNSNHRLPDTASLSSEHSLEVPSFLHWLLRPFLIYARRSDPGGKCDFSLVSIDPYEIEVAADRRYDPVKLG